MWPLFRPIEAMQTAHRKILRTAFVLGASADIGRALCERLLKDGWRVAGTGRNDARLGDLKKNPNFSFTHCDLDEKGAVRNLAGEFSRLGWQWDLFISSVGALEPIGPFFETDFDAWRKSFVLNSVAQLGVLHAVWPQRRPGETVHAMLMAGGGVNNPFPNYSAYCAAKIALIKMCELLDNEEKQLNIFIIGPGFVRTRIHEETLKAGAGAGPGLAKTMEFMKSEGTAMDDIYAHLLWCMRAGREVSGGRNFSTVHDPWRDGGAALANDLRKSADGFRLRRAKAGTA